MSDEEVSLSNDYATSTILNAYTAYLPTLYSKGPKGLDLKQKRFRFHNDTVWFHNNTCVDTLQIECASFIMRTTTNKKPFYESEEEQPQIRNLENRSTNNIFGGEPHPKAFARSNTAPLPLSLPSYALPVPWSLDRFQPSSGPPITMRMIARMLLRPEQKSTRRSKSLLCFLQMLMNVIQLKDYLLRVVRLDVISNLLACKWVDASSMVVLRIRLLGSQLCKSANQSVNQAQQIQSKKVLASWDSSFVTA
ncbi:hypothetical protein ACFE04_015021 [Oxalis oulophora]